MYLFIDFCKGTDTVHDRFTKPNVYCMLQRFNGQTARIIAAEKRGILSIFCFIILISNKQNMMPRLTQNESDVNS